MVRFHLASIFKGSLCIVTCFLWADTLQPACEPGEVSLEDNTLIVGLGLNHKPFNQDSWLLLSHHHTWDFSERVSKKVIWLDDTWKPASCSTAATDQPEKSSLIKCFGNPSSSVPSWTSKHTHLIWEINGIPCKRLKSQHVAVLDRSAPEGQQMQGKPDWYSNTLSCKERIGL